MKVLYYTDQIYLHGGLERVIANKVNYFCKHTDIKIYITTFQQNNYKPCYPIDDKVTHIDLGISYNRNLSFLHPKNILKAPKHFFKLRNLINDIKPDIVVVCNYEFGFYFIPLLAKKSLKIKEHHSSGHVSYTQRTINKSLLKKIQYKLEDYFEANYDYLVLLNKDELKYYTTSKKIVIPNAITHLPVSTNLNKQNKAISAGRIAPVKGFENLIDSWALVVKTIPNWHLDIFGDGETEYINKLKEQINNLNLESHITIHKSTNNLEKELQEASLYLMTSKTECFPMVLLEALSCNLPIVSFDCPNGPRNIITNNEDGILIEHNNNADFADAIINLIKNPSKRKTMEVNAKVNVKRFSEESVMNLWVELFNFNKKL